MVIKYALAFAVVSSALTGCVVHAEPRMVVYDDHCPPVYRIEPYPRPIIYPAPRYYEPPRFERYEYHEHHHDDRGYGYHHHERG